MKEIILRNCKKVLIDNKDYEIVSLFSWFLNSSGYAQTIVRLKGQKKWLSLLMHRLIANIPKNLYTDHINQNKLDNRKKNLRACTRSQNRMNVNSYKNSSSKFKGVVWNKRNKNWFAQIKLNNKVKYIGSFENEKLAAHAYNKEAVKLFGDFAKLNII